MLNCGAAILWGRKIGPQELPILGLMLKFPSGHSANSSMHRPPH